jgi:hypothetical protein
MKGTGMRNIIVGLLLTGIASLVSAQEKAVTISAGGAPALVLHVAQNAEVTATESRTVVKAKDLTLYLWPVSGVKTPTEALPRVADLIKSEFVNFKPSATNELSIAGAPAQRVIGKGNEADDGDPGAAEVVLFTTGKQVFAACIHGEFDDAARASKPMMAVLQSAKAP